jgi:hypothetical protein
MLEWTQDSKWILSSLAKFWYETSFLQGNSKMGAISALQLLSLQYCVQITLDLWHDIHCKYMWILVF